MNNGIEMRYIVTRASKNKEFIVGDHITVLPGGSIICREAGGFIVKEDVAEATEGWEIEIDKEWAAEEKRRIEQWLKDIENAEQKQKTT